MGAATLEEYRRRKGRANGEDHSAGTDAHELEQVLWRDVRLPDWADREVPERRWIVPGWIPHEQVTGIYGI